MGVYQINGNSLINRIENKNESVNYVNMKVSCTFSVKAANKVKLNCYATKNFAHELKEYSN